MAIKIKNIFHPQKYPFAHPLLVTPGTTAPTLFPKQPLIYFIIYCIVFRFWTLIQYNYFKIHPCCNIFQ